MDTSESKFHRKIIVSVMKKIVNRFHLDSIVAVTTYTDYTGGRDIYQWHLGFLKLSIRFVTVYCIGVLNAVLVPARLFMLLIIVRQISRLNFFHQAFQRMLEADDLDKITQKIPDDGIYKLKITNEALETHYIDKFNLILTEHPLGTEIYPEYGWRHDFI